MKESEKATTQNSIKELKKLLEQKNRELEIEVALERVRSRTMGMQKSDELAELNEIILQQIKILNVPLFAVGIHICNPKIPVTEAWIGNTLDGQMPKTIIDHSYDPLCVRMYRGWKDKKDLVIDILDGDALKEHFQNMAKYIPKQKTFEEFTPPDKLFFHLAYFSYGFFTFTTKKPSPEDHDIFKRFAKVFEQTYTRFLDLQKAEAQAHEAQIEAALERVRSRTMGMQKSDELAELNAIILQQVKILNVPLFAAGIHICNPEKPFTETWIGDPVEGQMPKTIIDHSQDPLCIRMYRGWKEKKDFIIDVMESDAIKEHFQNMAKYIPEQKMFEVPVLPDRLFYHLTYFSYGFFVFTTVRSCPENHDIFKRFAKVFEQTYTRFLDLQKAEAQAREAQIEAALERVRSRSMAMHKSDELSEVSALIFKELNVFCDQISASGVVLCDRDIPEQWMCSFDFTMLPPVHIPKNLDPVISNLFKAWESGVELYSEWVDGDLMKQHNTAMMGLPEIHALYKNIPMDANSSVPESQMNYVANFKQGYLLVITNSATDDTSLYPRFAKVFEQTYTRFLDLQKAEKQAREAKIEAALERVRSRTMGMQKSSELQEVINRIFIEMTGLGVKMDSSYIITHLEEDINKGFAAWVSIRELSYATELFQAYLDHPVVHRFYTAWKEKEPHFAATFSKAEKNRYFRHQFKFSPQLKLIPDHRKKTILDGNGWSLSWVIMKNAAIIVQRYQNNPFSEEEITIQKRFARVFEQTYTRFLDLKKAEAQAREAIKQASLDRVRGEIASMRTKDDLNRITPLIWKELNILGVPFIRCGVFIMNVNKRVIQTYLSTPDGNSLTAFEMSFDNEEIASGAVKNWRKNNIYQDFWNKEQFVSFMQNLIKTGQVKNVESFQGSAAPPESLYLNFVPFKQGMLYVGNISELKEEVLQLVQSLADSFSIAYARYEDFRQLEEAKNQIEKTFTDLKAAQSQLIQAEKMASLGELTAGIAHEIQNPLNFVNNFSEINSELVNEMKDEIDNKNFDEVKAIADDIKENEIKINHHGKRADAIVKGMLQHSRTSTGQKELTDINKLADEYLRLAYHGMRAKDKSFNADFKTEFDESLPKINVIPQDIGRVLLNLINNAFYAVQAPPPPKGGIKERGSDYKPTVIVRTSSYNPPSGGRGAVITVKDNGSGISQNIVDKIFQPFFTTKPTGSGTGLGLSLSYDIVKAHGGEIKVESIEGKGTEFIIHLPTN